MDFKGQKSSERVKFEPGTILGSSKVWNAVFGMTTSYSIKFHNWSKIDISLGYLDLASSSVSNFYKGWVVKIEKTKMSWLFSNIQTIFWHFLYTSEQKQFLSRRQCFFGSKSNYFKNNHSTFGTNYLLSWEKISNLMTSLVPYLNATRWDLGKIHICAKLPHFATTLTQSA